MKMGGKNGDKSMGIKNASVYRIIEPFLFCNLPGNLFPRILLEPKEAKALEKGWYPESL